VDPAGVGDDPMRREIEERSPGQSEPVGQERQLAPIVSTEVVDEQVRRREDNGEEPEDERRHEDGDDDEDDEDRQRWAHEEPEEHDGRHFDGAERSGGCDACQLGVLLELLSG
jgi:hypothetical protein